MNMTAENRVSAYVRRLRQGDVILDSDGKWLVTREPEVIDGKKVKVYLKPIPRLSRKDRSRAFLYEMDARVRVL